MSNDTSFLRHMKLDNNVFLFGMFALFVFVSSIIFYFAFGLHEIESNKGKEER